MARECLSYCPRINECQAALAYEQIIQPIIIGSSIPPTPTLSALTEAAKKSNSCPGPNYRWVEETRFVRIGIFFRREKVLVRTSECGLSQTR